MTFQKLVVMPSKLAQIKKENKKPNIIHSTENFQTGQTFLSSSQPLFQF